LLLTWRLLSGARPDVYEANPLAAALLEQFGWGGVALLKCGTSALIVLAILLVARRRPRVARRLAAGLCLLLASVVGYSGWLLSRPIDPLVQQLPHMAEEEARLTRMIAGVARFGNRRQAVCTAVLKGQIDLPTGVRRMRVILDEEKPNLSDHVRSYLPASDRPEEVASFLYYHASRLADAGVVEASLVEGLERQMSHDFPTAPRMNYRQAALCVPFPWGESRHVSADVPGPGSSS
jgi:hypothetical protein